MEDYCEKVSDVQISNETKVLTDFAATALEDLQEETVSSRYKSLNLLTRVLVACVLAAKTHSRPGTQVRGHVKS